MNTKIITAVIVLVSLFFVSCEIEETGPVVNLTFSNSAYTPIKVEVDGETKIMQPNESVFFEVKEKSTIEYIATTLGANSNDNVVGLDLEWKREITLSTSDYTEQLDVSSSYFFLMIGHNKENASPIKSITVSYDDGTTLSNNVDIPRSGSFSKIGYYYTNPGCRIDIFTANTQDYWVQASGDGGGVNEFLFEYKANQKIGLYTNKLGYLKKSTPRAVVADSRNSKCRVVHK